MATLNQIECAVKADKLFRTYFGVNKLGTNDPNFYGEIDTLDIDNQIEILNILENSIVINRYTGDEGKKIYSIVDQNIQLKQLNDLDNFRMQKNLFESHDPNREEQYSEHVSKLRMNYGLPDRLQDIEEIDDTQIADQIANELYDSHFGDNGKAVCENFVNRLRSECDRKPERELQVIDHLVQKINENKDQKYREVYKRSKISTFIGTQHNNQDSNKHHRVGSFLKQGRFKQQDKQLNALQGLKEHIEASLQSSSKKNMS